MFYWLPLSLFCLLLDQLSKSYVLTHLQLYQSLAIFPGLDFTLILNKGVAFGWFSSWANIKINLLSIITFISVLGLLYWLAISANARNAKKIGLSLIIGGSLGNLLDRCLYGFVIDFIDVSIKSLHWYVFNVADIAICIGVALIVFTTYQSSEQGSLSSPVTV